MPITAGGGDLVLVACNSGPLEDGPLYTLIGGGVLSEPSEGKESFGSKASEQLTPQSFLPRGVMPPQKGNTRCLNVPCRRLVIGRRTLITPKLSILRRSRHGRRAMSILIPNVVKLCPLFCLCYHVVRRRRLKLISLTLFMVYNLPLRLFKAFLLVTRLWIRLFTLVVYMLLLVILNVVNITSKTMLTLLTRHASRLLLVRS